MSTSTHRINHAVSAIGTILLTVAITAAIGTVSAGWAIAGEHDRRERHEREWRRYPREYRPYGYAAPPVVYAPQPVYAPPPVVYAPPPAPPSFNFVFPIRIH
jgi:hypothetical protein